MEKRSEGKRTNNFPCHYKIENGEGVIFLEVHTEVKDLLFWFIVPIIALCACWIGLFFACFWYCFPCDRQAREDNEEYHEINTFDTEKSGNFSTSDAGGVSSAGAPGMDGGGWPTKGPSSSDNSSWPLYWR